MNTIQPKRDTKDTKERYIAKKFCKHLSDDCRIIEGHRERPDFLIELDGCEIGLELAEIRRSGAFDQSVDGIQDFELFFQRQPRSDGRARGLIDVTPRHEAPRKTSEPGKYRFPHQDDFEAYYKELIALAQDHMPGTVHEERIVSFRDDHPEGDRWFASDERPKVQWITKQKYPRLCVCFDRFDLLGGDEDLFMGAVAFRQIALDEDEVCKVIKNHYEKLSAYRENLPSGCPVWLLKYTEGTATTRRICEKRHIHEIKRIYREMANGFNGEDRFDEVWLGTNVLLEDLLDHMVGKTISSPKSFHHLT